MERARELDILDRVMAHRAAGNTTDMAPEMYANPVATYVEEDRYEREVERLFRGCPIVACLSCDVAAPGDHVTLSITDVPVLVVRGEDGTVRAFRNVCRHRGVTVAEGRGCGARSFMCPFHGWSYRLDGRLVNPTHRAGFAGLDRSTHGLSEMACGEAAGLVFVHIDGAAGSLDAGEWLGELGAELTDIGVSNYEHLETRSSHRAMNWKLMGDTFCEQYHLRHLHHASFAAAIQSDNSLYDASDRHGRMVTPAFSIEELDHRPRPEWPLFPHVVLSYMIRPNTILLVQRDHTELFQLLPDGPGHSISRASLYSTQPTPSDAGRQRVTRAFDMILDVIDREDYEMCEQTQRSFGSGAQRELLFGRNEPGLIHFHQSVEALLHRPEVRDHRPRGASRPGGPAHLPTPERGVAVAAPLRRHGGDQDP